MEGEEGGRWDRRGEEGGERKETRVEVSTEVKGREVRRQAFLTFCRLKKLKLGEMSALLKVTWPVRVEVRI